MEKIFSLIDENKQNYLDDLFEFLKIESISADPNHSDDMQKCADWVVESIKKAGIDDVKLIETAGYPIVYAEYNGADPGAATVLLYGHYDVQPVDPIEKWDSDPFKPEIRDGKIFARGASDDKGQVFAHIKAIEAIMKSQGKLPVNLKLMIEGEEEAMVSHIDDFIKANRDLLNCDLVVVSDTEWFAKGLPSICYGLRGISFAEVTVSGPNRDLHSGTYGGAVDNPLIVLSGMIDKLKDNYGRITIPGFYDDVIELTDREREDFSKLPFDQAEYLKDLGLKSTRGEHDYSILERVWARPALDLNGIFGGYTGKGSKTVLPTHATAKISVRLVPDQSAEDIALKLKEHLLRLAPPTVSVEVEAFAGGNPVLVPRDSIAVRAAEIAFAKAFGKKPVFMREGGSIPVVELFDSVLKAPTALLGFGLPEDNIHSPNESFAVDNYIGGIKTAAAFYYEAKRK